MIIQFFSEGVLAFLSEIEELGFSLCLVGGAPRDFYYAHKVGHDFDFEIRPDSKLNTISDWPSYYERLHAFLDQKKLAYTKLPYLITRVFFEGVHFEFSSPRIEIDIPGNFTHHHFEAILNPELTYAESFKRRDFTINAIGIELLLKNKSESLVDPYSGLNDLKIGVFQNISDDFFLDSVRFLRLIRFQIKFETFTIDKKLLESLNKFNLSDLSVHHFREELFKSRPGAFLNKFRELVTEHKLVVPKEFSFWIKYVFPETLASAEELLAFVYLMDVKDAHELSQFFSLPEKKLRDLKSFNDSVLLLKDITESDLQKLLRLPQDQALNQSLLKELKNFDEKKAWRSILSFLRPETNDLISSIDFSVVNVTPDELSAVKPASRSYYKYYKTLKMKFSK